jgi:small subunit ribosomal protein S17
MAEQTTTSKQRERQGVVVSNKMDKTIVVQVDAVQPHAEYKKVVRRTSRLKAHDENNEARIGDTVLVRECRPLSRDKTWRLIKVLERAE